MSSQRWILEALRYHAKEGATLREIQRYIDEHFYEELAVDTLKQSLKALMDQGEVEQNLERYKLRKLKSAKTAFDDLFKA
ncbi:MAG: hypothetical protein R2880_01585 [Deinococcales bacterium]